MPLSSLRTFAGRPDSKQSSFLFISCASRWTIRWQLWWLNPLIHACRLWGHRPMRRGLQPHLRLMQYFFRVFRNGFLVRGPMHRLRVRQLRLTMLGSTSPHGTVGSRSYCRAPWSTLNGWRCLVCAFGGAASLRLFSVTCETRMGPIGRTACGPLAGVSRGVVGVPMSRLLRTNLTRGAERHDGWLRLVK